ncbi:hypothetical protein A6R68_22392 [Neotoma lepida]|uniref:TLC domain-containing protein n=1 Tax=Neotoma lepida TaxID=56216 RepID=A0A1A6HZD0_NEOLE|nr:hypothetical protein A6R68_22392 [Neotoma lepida]
MTNRLWLYPQMVTDPIHGHPSWAVVLVAVSVGYFLADGVDMLWNQTLAQAWDLLCHHVVVVSCLSTAVLSGHYVGLAMVSLLLELNSICLHLRKLLLLSRWITLWLFRQHYQVSLAVVILCVTGLVTVGTMSISLGIRILIRDVLQSRPNPFIFVDKETPKTKTHDDMTATDVGIVEQYLPLIWYITTHLRQDRDTDVTQFRGVFLQR